MPRRKANSNNNINADNNNEDIGEPKRKLQRINFQVQLPIRPKEIGRVLVCGQGDVGQLGLGEDDTKFERKRPALIENIENAVDVCAGGMHNLVLTDDGKIYSFGCNDEGALGRDSSAEGSEYTPNLIDLPGKVLKISAGDSHSACLLEDGRVYAWGSFRDSHGNMGLTLEGNKRLPIHLLPNLLCSDIASGADHLVILTAHGKVYTVGCGEQGQLGRVTARSATGETRRGKTELLSPGLVFIKRSKPIEAIWATNYSTFLRESQTGNVYAFGLNNYKQLANGTDTDLVNNPLNTKFNDVKAISGGEHHTIVLKTSGAVYSIGRCDYGRLGLGSVAKDVTELKPIAGLAGKNIISISCGASHSFAVTEDGKLYTWGNGSSYQLGSGSEDDALEPILITSKQTENKRILNASGGGQHSIFLVEDDNSKKLSKISIKASTITTDKITKEKNASTKTTTAAVTVTETETTASATEIKEVKNTTEAADSQSEVISDSNGVSKRGRKKK